MSYDRFDISRPLSNTMPEFAFTIGLQVAFAVGFYFAYRYVRQQLTIALDGLRQHVFKKQRKQAEKINALQAAFNANTERLERLISMSGKEQHLPSPTESPLARAERRLIQSTVRVADDNKPIG